MTWTHWEERRAKNANIGRKGKHKNKVKITLTNNMLVGISIASAAFLYETEQEHELYDGVRALYNLLPARESLYKTSNWLGEDYVYLPSKSKKYPFDVEHLPTLVFVLKLVEKLPGMQGGAVRRRIKDIEALPALQLLALADADAGNNTPT